MTRLSPGFFATVFSEAFILFTRAITTWGLAAKSCFLPVDFLGREPFLPAV